MSTTKIYQIHTCTSLELLDEFCLFVAMCYCSFHDFFFPITSSTGFTFSEKKKYPVFLIKRLWGNLSNSCLLHFHADSYFNFSVLSYHSLTVLITLLMYKSYRIFNNILFQINFK